MLTYESSGSQIQSVLWLYISVGLAEGVDCPDAGDANGWVCMLGLKTDGYRSGWGFLR